MSLGQTNILNHFLLDNDSRLTMDKLDMHLWPCIEMSFSCSDLIGPNENGEGSISL